MKRLVIEIISHGLSSFDVPFRAKIGGEHYTKFVRAAMKLGLCYDIRDNIPVTCPDCHSFIIGLAHLYQLIEDVLDSPEFSDFFRIITRTKDKIEDHWWDLDEEFSEGAIIFDMNCACNRTLVGEPLKQDDDEIDFGTPGGRVTKFVGPRTHWS